MQRKHEFRSRIFKALGHPSRIILVDALLHGEQCVCKLRDLVKADISTVSKHLSLLKEAGVVGCEKRGANVYYFLRMECVRGFLACVDRLNPLGDEDHACVLCGSPGISVRGQKAGEQLGVCPLESTSNDTFPGRTVQRGPTRRSIR